MTVLERFTETVGVVRTEKYSVVSTYPVLDIARVLSELPQYPGALVEVATVRIGPGESFLLMRPAAAKRPVWFCACPMVADNKR